MRKTGRLLATLIAVALLVGAIGAIPVMACNLDTQQNCGSLHDHAPPPALDPVDSVVDNAHSAVQYLAGTSRSNPHGTTLVGTATSVTNAVVPETKASTPTYNCFDAYDSNGNKYRSCHWSH